MPFICFEGIDGSGKTTLAKIVGERLQEAGYQVVHLREGKELLSPLGNSIRNIAKDPAHIAMSSWSEFLIYLAREKQVFDEMVQPLEIDDKTFVFADRSMYSPQVMAQDIRGIDSPLISQIIAEMWAGREPDMVCFCDVDLAVSQTRKKIAKQSEPSFKINSRKGLWGLKFRELMRQGYHRLSLSDDRWVKINNNGHSTDAATQQILRAFEQKFGLDLQLGAAIQAEHSLWIPQLKSTLESATSTPEKVELLSSGLMNQLSDSHPFMQGFLLSGLHDSIWQGPREQLFQSQPLAGIYSLKGTSEQGVKAPYLDQAFQSGDSEQVISAFKVLNEGVEMTWEWDYIQQYAHLNPTEAISAIKGVDSIQADAIRQEYLSQYPKEVIISLSGLDTESSWDLRKQFIKGPENKVKRKYRDSLLLSLSRVQSGLAWELREKYYEEHTWSTLLSLKETDHEAHPIALEWRQENIDRAPKLVLKTLRGCEDSASWDLRQRGLGSYAEVLDSIKYSTNIQADVIRHQLWDEFSFWVYNTISLEERLKDLDENIWFHKAIQDFPDHILMIKSILQMEDKKQRGWTWIR